jgi:DNA-binding transcriptional LysR family regulator
MRPSLSQLETFYWIARLGSFRAAGRHLNLTQPAVSLRIRELEIAIRTQLFERTRQRATLSAEGVRLVPIAEKMLALADEIESARRADPLRGLLRVGAVDTVAMLCMTQFMIAMKSRYPGLRVELSVEVSTQLAARVQEREIDLGFVTDPDLGSHIESQRLGPIALAWMASTTLPIPRRTVGPADLIDQQIITNPRPSQLYETTLGWFRDIPAESIHLSTCNSLALIARYVVAAFGISILPPVTLAEEVRAGQVRVLESQPAIAPRILHACYARDRDDRGMREAVAVMHEIVRSTGVVSGA